jgi:hypothetical protein
MQAFPPGPHLLALQLSEQVGRDIDIAKRIFAGALVVALSRTSAVRICDAVDVAPVAEAGGFLFLLLLLNTDFLLLLSVVVVVVVVIFECQAVLARQ